MPRRFAFFALLLVLALAAPAAATHGDIHPLFKTSTVYFHCLESPFRVANGAAAQGTVPGWNTSSPPGSVTDNNGCLTLDPPVTQPAIVNPVDGVFRGSVVGNLKAMTVRLNTFPPIQPDGAITLGVKLVVDGVSIFGGTATAPTARTITVFPNSENSGITSSVAFSVAGLPFALEDGNGTANRTMTLAVAAASTAVSWSYDTSEVESGITFNPAGALMAPVINV